MVSGDLEKFFCDNPLLYGHVSAEDIEQLSRIYKMYPDHVRLLGDREAVKLDHFNCERCGTCCTSIKYITVCHSDVKRWVSHKRWDILEKLDIDRRRTPLLASCGADAITSAKRAAYNALDMPDLPDRERVHELLYLTDLLESAVYVARKNGACAFFQEKEGLSTCRIHDTKPRVCQKFPYYIGQYTDYRLIGKDSFCPSLRKIAEKMSSLPRR